MDAKPEHPDTANEAREFLQSLRGENISKLEEASESDDDRNWAMNYIRDIKRDLSNPSQVLPELLQNADDVDGDEPCNSVIIQLTESGLRIWNNGRPMNKSEVQSLCGLGESTKRLADQDFIGHFGRGFKSVFNISNQIRIRSGYFHFSLDSDQLVVPFDICESDIKATGTEVILPFKHDLDAEDLNRLKSRIKSIERLLPYLQRVSTITINWFGDVTTYHKKINADENEVFLYSDGELEESRKLFASRGVPTGKARREVINHRNLDDPSDADLETLVLISVRVNGQGDPIPELDRSRLFNYLPTQEKPDLPFDIQADFLLDSNRSSLHDGKNDYNKWLFRQTGECFGKLVKYYKENSSYRDAHLRVIPINPRFDVVQETICEELNGTKCIPTTADDFAEPEGVIVPTERLRSALTDDTLSKLLNSQVSYPAPDLDSDLVDDLVEIGLLSEYDVRDVMQECLDLETGTNVLNQRELLKFVQSISDYEQNEISSYGITGNNEEEEFKSVLNSLYLLPIEEDRRRAFDELDAEPMIPSQEHQSSLNLFAYELPLLDLSLEQTITDTDQPEKSESTRSLDTDETVVNRALEAYQNLFDLSKLTPTQAIKRIIAPAFNNIDEYDDDTLDEYLSFIFTNIERWDAAETHLTGTIKLKTRSGEYKGPEKTPVFFPDSYGGNYSRETVLESTDTLFLSEKYLQLGDTPEPIDSEWKSRCREFFTTFDIRDYLPLEIEDRHERTTYSEQDLRDHFGENSETMELPDSIQSTVIDWMNGREYAIKDVKPGDTLDEILTNFEEDNAEHEAGMELAKMIDSHWDQYEDGTNIYLNYVYRGRNARHEVGEQKIDQLSTFGRRIRNTAWFPTDDRSLAPPASLVTEDTVATGGVSVPRCGYSPDPNCREALGISKTLDWRKAIQVLETASDAWMNRPPEKIKNDILRLLNTVNAEWKEAPNDRRQEIIDRLKETRCLYVEGTSSSFRKPAEVALDGSDLGDFLVTLDRTYQQYIDLLQALGVVEEIGLEEHLDYLSYCDTIEDIDQIATVWSRTIGYLADEFGPENPDTNEDIREKLNSTKCLLTENDTFASLADVGYYSYDEELLNHLTDQDIQSQTVGVQAIGTPGKNWPPTWEELGLKNLGSFLILSPVVDDTSNETNSISTLATTSEDDLEQLLNVTYSFVSSEADPKIEVKSKLTEIAKRYSIHNDNDIEVEYIKPNPKSSVTEPFTIQSFIDTQTETIHIGEDVDARYDFADRLANQLSGYLDQGELVEVLTGALRKYDAHLCAYLGDHGIQYRSFPEEQDNIDHQSSKISSDDPETPTDENEHSTTEDSATPTNSSEQSSPADTTTSSETKKDAAGSVDSNSNEKSSSSSVTSSTESELENSNKGSTTSSTADTDQSVDSKSSEPAEQQTDQDSVYLGGDSQDSKDTASISKALDSTPAKIIPNQIEQASADSFSSGSGGGGGGGTASGGETAVDVGKWGEDYMMVRLVRFLCEKLNSDSLSEEWDWSGVHPETNDTVERAQVNASGFECPLTEALVPGVQFTENELQHPVTLFHTGESGVGADIYVRGAAIRQDTDSDALELREIGPDAETWIEVKSTEASPQTRTEVNFHSNEYQRAHLEGENYLIIRVCNARSEDVVISRVFSSLAELERRGSVSVDGELTLTF